MLLPWLVGWLRIIHYTSSLQICHNNDDTHELHIRLYVWHWKMYMARSMAEFTCKSFNNTNKGITLPINSKMEFSFFCCNFVPKASQDFRTSLSVMRKEYVFSFFTIHLSLAHDLVCLWRAEMLSHRRCMVAGNELKGNVYTKAKTIHFATLLTGRENPSARYNVQSSPLHSMPWCTKKRSV